MRHHDRDHVAKDNGTHLDKEYPLGVEALGVALELQGRGGGVGPRGGEQERPDHQDLGQVVRQQVCEGDGDQ